MTIIDDAFTAIEARIKGDFDNPALKEYGPLTTVEADILNIKILTLRDYGFIVGARDPRINRNYSGKFMVAEGHDESELPTDDGSNGPWCVVGDDLTDLVNTAFEFLEGSML